MDVEDASGYRGQADQLLTPSSSVELAALLAQASGAGTPVTAWGSGTGITGGCCPSQGWLISLDRFRKLDVGRGSAWVGAGVPLKDLQTAAAATGQFYAPDPTEWSASIGGNIATNASGSRSFRYGSTRRHLLALTVALMDGSVRTWRRGEKLDFPYAPLPAPATTKNTAGYYLPPEAEWVDLLCGSEGTLGIVLEAEVALLKQPAQILSGVVFFDDDALALEAVDAWRGVSQLRMLEYMDSPSLGFLRGPYGDEIPPAARACLMVEQELDGLPGEPLDQWLERLEHARALEDSWFGETARDRERFRAFRHALPEQVNARVRQNGFQKLSSDFAVPIGRNGEMLRFYQQTLLEEFSGKFTIYGHIGDAHVHVNVLSESERDYDRGRQWMLSAARQAVALGGTVSAEHGLGKRKAHFLPLMFSQAEIESMKAVKRRLDPQWLLGAGNIFPGGLESFQM
ncbi:MAG: FAD-binding oxidoreductase [Candidatus Solibacter usitatus]|nr:FAD-binding oxidoreductase [Candidatus Solibacter usitatus]